MTGIVLRIGGSHSRVFDGDQNRPRQYPARAGRSHLDLGGDSTVPSCTITLINELVHASAWSCASTFSTTVITFVIITSAAFMVPCAKSFYRSQANSLI